MANNWNKMPLFEYDIQVNMEDNMANALMHLFNVIGELRFIPHVGLSLHCFQNKGSFHILSGVKNPRANGFLVL